MDHSEAWTVFGRFVAGGRVPREDEERALAHAGTCDVCARELGADLLASADEPVDPDAVFDRALTAALRTHPDSIARVRAAEQLGARGRVSPGTLAALADAARGDREARVREAARRAQEALRGSDGPLPRPGGLAPA